MLVVIAAACVYALDHHVARLADDHANARALARGLSQIPGITVQQPDTNLVFFELVSAQLTPQRLLGELRSKGVLLTQLGGRFRATGVRPKCCERLKACGIHLPPDMFEGVTEVR